MMMAVNAAAAAVLATPPWRRWRVSCLASASNSTEKLRSELDHLHSEAETTRAKASSARLRLMRLSEQAEKLQRQAAISIQTGKDNYARELLFQKKRIMQALDKLMKRIEILDELSAKLNEAVTLKETQLIGNVGLDIEVGQEKASGPVRIVPPDEEVSLHDVETCESGQINISEGSGVPLCYEELNSEAKFESETTDESVKNTSTNEKGSLGSLRDVSSYKDFLEHLDRQLNNVEADLITVIRLSTLVSDTDETPKNTKTRHTMEILESIQKIRERIKQIRGDGF